MQQARLSGADADSFVIVFAAMGVKNDIADSASIDEMPVLI